MAQVIRRLPAWLENRTPSTTNSLLRFEVPQVNCIVESAAHAVPKFETGELYITEDLGLALNYPYIVLHALSRTQESSTSDAVDNCIYCQIGATIHNATSQEAGPTNHDSADETSDTEDYDTIGAEVFFVPKDPATLADLYQAISECAALHPDLDASEDELSSDNSSGHDQEGDWEDNWVPGNAAIHLRKAFSEHARIHSIDFRRDDTVGYIRLQSPGARRLVEKLNIIGMRVNGYPLALEWLEGMNETLKVEGFDHVAITSYRTLVLTNI
ncbi:hypothetical protein IWQ62_000336 [Dispira parvispora]|uniref:Uncharacterized protein n=1 Tax=Dispira parvispora TaxID=1520584 RepID=A0A9W8AX77_9FUNG|nr:hypothetical protein IWQ62_000336 [Dispira parvispora]